MALRPIWWWFGLGWFPLFWFYPTLINAPIKNNKANGDKSYSYYSGVGSIIAWVFFVSFLVLFLSVALDSTWYIVYEIIWIFALFFIVIFWCVGIGHYVTFEDEFNKDEAIIQQDEEDVNSDPGENETKSDLQPMRMLSLIHISEPTRPY